MKRQMILMSNLHCPSCAAKLEKAAQKMPGMKTAKVAFGNGALNVEYDESALKEESIRAVVKQFGLEIATVIAAPGARA